MQCFPVMSLARLDTKGCTRGICNVPTGSGCAAGCHVLACCYAMLLHMLGKVTGFPAELAMHSLHPACCICLRAPCWADHDDCHLCVPSDEASWAVQAQL